MNESTIVRLSEYFCLGATMTVKKNYQWERTVNIVNLYLSSGFEYFTLVQHSPCISISLVLYSSVILNIELYYYVFIFTQCISSDAAFCV